LVATSTLVGLSTPAWASTCEPPDQLVQVEVTDEDGNIDYVWECRRSGGDGNDNGDGNGNGNNEPSCDFSWIPSPYWDDEQRMCVDTLPCIVRVPSLLSEESWPDERPEPHAIYTYHQCFLESGATDSYWWDWYIPDEPPIEDLAWQAFGRLSAPAFTLAFNPPQRTYVTLDTWWWADGAGEGDIVGSAAFGVQAIGEPDYIEINPGDGSPAFTCPWTSAESDVCTHVYRRASVNGSASAPDGSPAYPAEARLVYAVRFTQNGTPLDLPGLPDSLEGPWVSTSVPVAEIQSIVVD
jgi:hypothetical protein